MGMDAGSIIGGMGGLIGSFVQSATATGINYDQEQLAKYGYEQQRQMIREQNEYNSPLNQMKRYEEAGLNPNLIYGEGKASAGNQSEIAKYNAPTLHVPDVASGIQNAINNAVAIEMAKQDIAIKKQSLDNLKEEQFNIRAERMSRDIENMFQAAITGFDPGLVTSQEERDMVLGGMRIGKYKAETSSLESIAALRNANKLVAELDAKQKQWVYDNLNPLTLELANLDLNSRNLDYELDKIIYQYEKSIKQTFGSHTGEVDKLLSVLSQIISIFVPKMSISSGNVGNTLYRRKSVTYP